MLVIVKKNDSMVLIFFFIGYSGGRETCSVIGRLPKSFNFCLISLKIKLLRSNDESYKICSSRN